jgi:hypothetical protein
VLAVVQHSGFKEEVDMVSTTVKEQDYGFNGEAAAVMVLTPTPCTNDPNKPGFNTGKAPCCPS